MLSSLCASLQALEDNNTIRIYSPSSFSSSSSRSPLVRRALSCKKAQPLTDLAEGMCSETTRVRPKLVVSLLMVRSTFSLASKIFERPDLLRWWIRKTESRKSFSFNLFWEKKGEEEEGGKGERAWGGGGGKRKEVSPSATRSDEKRGYADKDIIEARRH